MTTTSQTRSSLLTRLRGSDSRAWTELVDLYGPLVTHWCIRRGLSGHAAADCVQEVFAAVHRSIDQFKPTRVSGSFRAWLWTITSRKIVDHWRSEGRHAVPAGGSTAAANLHSVADPIAATVDSASDVVMEPREPSDANQVDALVRRAMDQVRLEFTERTWRIFCRSVLDDQPTDRVAEEFSVSKASVRQTRSRVLRRIRCQLGDVEP
ncbi:MAG: sigma-70 family RNA polymerase sigma factor [Planctomycetota bacterium]